jgi:hypothetical protein
MMSSILSVLFVFMQQKANVCESRSPTKFLFFYRAAKTNGLPFKRVTDSSAEYPHDFEPEPSLYNITRLHHQMQLVKYLEDARIGEADKLRKIEENPDLLRNDSKYVVNLLEGGLMKDW